MIQNTKTPTKATLRQWNDTQKETTLWLYSSTSHPLLHTVLSTSKYHESPANTFVVVIVQLPSCVQLFATLWTAACQVFLSFTISWSLLKFMSIESVMLSNHLILFCPLLLPSILPSIRVFSNELALHIRWPKYWSFSFRSVFPMNIQGLFPLGLTGLISLLSNKLSRVFSSTTISKH